MSASNWQHVYRIQTGRIEELERENAALRALAVELAAIGRVWIHVHADTLSPSNVQRFTELEQQILRRAKP